MGMNGILVVDKPQGFTSFDVVAKLRGICQTRKIGHGGTLDPMATGVLPVFISGAAKAVDLQPRQDKTYEATLQFGLATDTGDITGEVLETSDLVIMEQDFEAVLPRFEGEQQQLPPMYSAVKVNGKALYRYAREGQEVERKSRTITVHSIQYLGKGEKDNQFVIRVHCSKGTYIRTLSEDIGKALGVPATLAALRRTQAGMFTIEEALTLAEIQQAKDEGRLESLLLPIAKVFDEMPKHTLGERDIRRLCNGAVVYGQKIAPGRYAVYGPKGFAGLACMQPDGLLCGEKIFYDTEQE